MRAILILAMVLVACAGYAQNKPPASGDEIFALGVAGIGVKKCSDYIAVTQANSNAQEARVIESIYLSWAQGFMSGINQGFYTSDFPMRKDLVTWTGYTQTAHLQAYCGKNPSDFFLMAVWDLYQSLPKAPVGAPGARRTK